jgi:hypothetical protein
MMASMLTLILTGFLFALRTRRALALENLALRHQLAVLQRAAPPLAACAIATSARRHSPAPPSSRPPNASQWPSSACRCSFSIANLVWP